MLKSKRGVVKDPLLSAWQVVRGRRGELDVVDEPANLVWLPLYSIDVEVIGYRPVGKGENGPATPKVGSAVRSACFGAFGHTTRTAPPNTRCWPTSTTSPVSSKPATSGKCTEEVPTIT